MHISVIDKFLYHDYENNSAKPFCCFKKSDISIFPEKSITCRVLQIYEDIELNARYLQLKIQRDQTLNEYFKQVLSKC